MHTSTGRNTAAAPFYPPVSTPTRPPAGPSNAAVSDQNFSFSDDSDLWTNDQFVRMETETKTNSSTPANTTPISSTRSDANAARKQEWFSAAIEGDATRLNRLYGQRRVDLDERDNLGKNALHLAAEEGKYEAVDYLLRYTPIWFDLRSESRKNALHYAAVGGTPDYVKCADLLLRAAGHQARAYANTQDWVGQTPLMYAASSGSEAMVRLLLNNGADPEGENVYGSNALMDAAARGYQNIADLLLSTQLIRINKPNFLGTTALMMAAREGHLDMVKYLLNQGADPTLRDKRHHHSALDLAKQRLAQANTEAEKASYHEIINQLQTAQVNYHKTPQTGLQQESCTLVFKKEPVPSIRNLYMSANHDSATSLQ